MADWVRFEAQAGQTYEIATLDLERYCDTVIDLYGPDGHTLLEQDDDSGPEWASRIEWTSPASGIYYVKVLEYFGRTGPDTGYAIGVNQVVPNCQPDAYEPDGHPGTAAAFVVDGPPQEHSFCLQEDIADWVTFAGVQGTTYVIETLDLGPNADTVLTLYGTDGTTVLLADDNGGTAPRASRLEWTCPASGSYFVRVEDALGRTGPQTDYRLSIAIATITVRGTVYLQGRTAFDGTLVTVEPASHTVTTGISGTFSVTATVPSTITARHAGYLLAEWSITPPVEPTLTLEPVRLWGGDINGDRVIDILDLVYLGSRFGGTDVLADLNGDGTVDILDIVMTANNFWKRV
jgi:hypothetical protein